MIKLPNKRLKKPRFSGQSWTLQDITDADQIISSIADKYGWQGYPTQIEIINNTQMNEMQVSHGLPVQLPYWLNGKRMLQVEEDYKQHGNHILELVINTNPSICYIMDHNSLAQQLLVLQHAKHGHNFFFKNNYLFKEWSQADTIIDFLIYAREFILECETRYGLSIVEHTLSGAEFLSRYSVHKYQRAFISKEKEKAQMNARLEFKRTHFNEIFRDSRNEVNNGTKDFLQELAKDIADFSKTNESILEFLELQDHHDSFLDDWQREIFRIIRIKEQYFYPQIQTKLMNEGFAMFCEAQLMNDMYDYGYIDDSIMLEFCQDESNVTFQSKFNLQEVQRINPYYLGREIFNEIKRVCESPTEEDIEFLPTIAGTNWNETVNFVVANYRDESFIKEFLTPNLIRRLKLFSIKTDIGDEVYTISNIHRDRDYSVLRELLSEQYAWSEYFPSVEISNATDHDSAHILIEILEKNNNSLTQKSFDKLRLWVKAVQKLPVEINVLQQTTGSYGLRVIQTSRTG